MMIYKVLTLTLIISYFIYHSIFGARGILATIDIDQAIIEKNLYLKILQNNRELIESKLNSLKLNFIDVDYIDEVARKELGMAETNEIVLILK